MRSLTYCLPIVLLAACAPDGKGGDTDTVDGTDVAPDTDTQPDTDGGGGGGDTDVPVDAAPTVEIVLPQSDDVYAEGAGITFEGSVADDLTPAGALALTWVDDVDGTLSTDAANADGVSAFARSDLAPGPHTLTFTATDAGGHPASADVSFVVNGRPDVPSVTIEPDPAYTQDGLVAVAVDTDPEGDALVYTYAWTRDGVDAGITDPTVPADATTRDEVWTVSVTASDGLNTSEASVASILIENSPPVITEVALTPGTAFEATTMVCTPSGADLDGDAVSFAYTWTVNGTTIGATGSVLSGTSFSKGDLVACAATPFDGTGFGAKSTSSAVLILDSAPTAPAVTVSPARPWAGTDPLVCALASTSSDADGDTLTYDFAWTRDGVPYLGAANGATSSTVPPADTGVGTNWQCSATANDGTTSSSAGTASVSTVHSLTYFGYPTPFGSNSSIGGNNLFAERVTISAGHDLRTLGFIGRAINTASIRIALYTDAAGAPGTLVGYTDAFVPTSATDVAVAGGPVPLAAGNYWMVWMNNTTLAGYYSVTCAGVVTYYKAYTYGSFPATWPSGASSLTGQCNNLYVGTL